MSCDQSRDGRSGRIPRRGVLAALGGMGAAGAYLLADRPSTSSGGWCPSDEEMETRSWIRGRFERQTRTVAFGERFTSTLTLENGGGEAGTYGSTVWFAKREDNATVEMRRADSISVTVPARDSTETTITAEAPEAGGRWRLEVPRLASTCDLIIPAVQQLELTEVSAGGA